MCVSVILHVCVGYTLLGANTLEIALIWILSVSSNHSHVTSSPKAPHTYSRCRAEPRRFIVFYPYYYTPAQEMGSPHLFSPAQAEGRGLRVHEVTVTLCTPMSFYTLFEELLRGKETL